jgi:hypothetical protein
MKTMILEAKEVTVITKSGKPALNNKGQVIQPCPHPQIPGLDASFCQACRIWWVDKQMVELVLESKRKSYGSGNDGDDKSK